MNSAQSASQKGDESRGRNPVVRENIEAFAIAIIMALILKFFCVEAFKIPTGSMQPTLIGADRNTLIDRNGREIFDRILVNKFIYDLRPPARWDIIVFQYPLEQSKNYIKRLIGLPGETIEIRDGDVYVDGEIARKPEKVQEALWRRVDAPHPRQPNEPPLFAQTQSWKSRTDDEIRTTSDGGLRLEAKDGTTTMLFDRRILNDYLHGYDSSYGIETRVLEDAYAVGDLRLVLTAQIEDRTGGLTLTLIDREDTFRVFLAGSDSETPSFIDLESSRVDEGAVPLSVETTGTGYEAKPESGRVVLKGLRLPTGQPRRISLAHVDDALELHFEDSLVCRVLLELPPPSEPRRVQRQRASDPSQYGREREVALYGQSGIEIGVTNNRAVLHDGELYRDVYYTRVSSRLHESMGHFEVPEEHYFTLGDNTQNSKDGRQWETYTYRLSGGRQIRGDFVDSGPDENPRAIGLQTQFKDVFGETHVFVHTDIVEGPIHEVAPFIPARFVLGQAFFVFWPLFSPFRMRFLN